MAAISPSRRLFAKWRCVIDLKKVSIVWPPTGFFFEPFLISSSAMTSCACQMT